MPASSDALRGRGSAESRRRWCRVLGVIEVSEVGKEEEESLFSGRRDRTDQVGRDSSAGRSAVGRAGEGGVREARVSVDGTVE